MRWLYRSRANSRDTLSRGVDFGPWCTRTVPEWPLRAKRVFGGVCGTDSDRLWCWYVPNTFPKALQDASLPLPPGPRSAVSLELVCVYFHRPTCAHKHSLARRGRVWQRGWQANGRLDHMLVVTVTNTSAPRNVCWSPPFRAPEAHTLCRRALLSVAPGWRRCGPSSRDGRV